MEIGFNIRSEQAVITAVLTWVSPFVQDKMSCPELTMEKLSVPKEFQINDKYVLMYFCILFFNMLGYCTRSLLRATKVCQLT